MPTSGLSGYYPLTTLLQSFLLTLQFEKFRLMHQVTCIEFNHWHMRKRQLPTYFGVVWVLSSHHPASILFINATIGKVQTHASSHMY